jgi:hypothetical protein
MIRAAAVTGVALAGILVATTRGEEPDTPAVHTATTKITRQDLVETESADGTLGYADARTVTPKLPGTVTWLPEPGATVTPNHRLLEIDGKGVYLFDGDVPAFRALTPGLRGEDVRQLQRNLDVPATGTYDDATAQAVEAWQRAKGLPETGTIELGRIVFQPGTRRIGETKATVGGAPAPLSTTATRRVVMVQLDTAKADLARTGDRVDIELPSGETTTGTIDEVGRVATQLPDAEATIELTISTRARGLDHAPVEVRLERERAQDALTIPVTALLARPNGEFAVELRERGARRTVRVEPGLFAGGSVEIEGEGLREGQPVTNAEL